MQYLTDELMTAMEIRERVSGMMSFLGIGAVLVLVKGSWEDWINGEEFSPHPVSIDTFCPVTRIGTRYIQFEQELEDGSGRRYEVKPELSDPSWEIMFRPEDQTYWGSSLPKTLYNLFQFILWNHPVKIKSMAQLGVPTKNLPVYLSLLQEAGLIESSKVGRYLNFYPAGL